MARPKLTGDSTELDTTLSPEDSSRRSVMRRTKSRADNYPDAVKGIYDKPGDRLKLRPSKSVSDPYKYRDSDSSAGKRKGPSFDEKVDSISKGREIGRGIAGRSATIPDAGLSKDKAGEPRKFMDSDSSLSKGRERGLRFTTPTKGRVSVRKRST